MDVVHEQAPSAKLCLNTHLVTTTEAVLRWIEVAAVASNGAAPYGASKAPARRPRGPAKEPSADVR